ncbi:DUF2238 domain-containing protein [Aporhodopirellula aestuarii]|uniref:DUF2238 domain-containing protein n=1 Tax=Aporhodopirellula aestuarii TaxID=2950107 RepID=A0ABT0U4W2_9BACT|nr:DUF2238 domain-containing protein [Aporhodopirellula aestuarii]MCM2371943.1 DUF2238 domain-containing protein [Aporhodopirellula aestuarii]
MRLALIVLTAMAIPLSFVDAPYPNELLLQHAPTTLGVALLTFAVVRFRPSNLSIMCCLGFLWLHIVGARWIYSYVPYDDFIQMLTGRSLSESFGWERNHYDRFVHFASGVLGLPPISNYLQSFCRVSPAAAALLAMACVLAIGAAYEVLEWQIAMTFSPEMAESYNGQQGDVWDAQKDLALAWLGAIVTVPMIYRWVPVPVSYREAPVTK